jgi:hypothetical protein
MHVLSLWIAVFLKWTILAANVVVVARLLLRHHPFSRKARKRTQQERECLP